MPRHHVPWAVGAAAVLLAAGLSVRLVHAADPDKGKTVFEQCAACHSLVESDQSDGPTLKGVFGRAAASREDYRYSAAMTRSGVTWDAATLDQFVADPQAFIPGNRMAFGGITDKAQRDDLIAYLGIATR